MIHEVTEGVFPCAGEQHVFVVLTCKDAGPCQRRILRRTHIRQDLGTQPAAVPVHVDGPATAEYELYVTAVAGSGSYTLSVTIDT